VSRHDDLERVERSLTRIARVASGRGAMQLRAERSGVALSRPGLSILSGLHASGPVRLSRLAHLTDMETALVSREVARLVQDGYVRRDADPTDGRATIVQLTDDGCRAYARYRSATDEIVFETFSGWSGKELHVLAELLERVAVDVAHGPRSNGAGAR
jgi:DNA-binding MarR family transcriptional regulator